MIFYTNLFVPNGFNGITIGFIILIRPQYRADDGILVHEKAHVRQFWSSFGLMPLLYLMSKTYRLKYEVEAYKAQLKCYPDDRTKIFAGFLATKYQLGITTAEAEALLK